MASRPLISPHEKPLDFDIGVERGEACPGPALVQSTHERVDRSALDNFARQTLHRTFASGAAIALQMQGEFVCVASAGETAPPVGATLDANSGLSGLSLRTGWVLVCKDSETDARVSKEACRSLGIRSVATVPVVCHGRNAGLLEAFSREPRAFDDAALDALRNLAVMISSTLAGEQSKAVNETDTPAATVRVPADDVLVDYRPALMSEQSGLSKYVLRSGAIAVLGMLVMAAIMFGPRLLPPSPPRAGVVTPPEQFSRIAASAGRRSRGDRERVKPASSTASNNGNEARTLERSAMKPGNAEAQYELATAFAEGQGVKQDLVQAYAWYVVAGMSGNTDSDAAIRSLTQRLPEASIAQVRLRIGQMFRKGYGVPQDPVAAYFWYTVAQAAGQPQAAAERQSLEQAMTARQVEEANLRAEKWLAEHSSGPAPNSSGSDRQ